MDSLKTSIISPQRKKEYSWEEILQEALVRENIDYASCKIKKENKGYTVDAAILSLPGEPQEKPIELEIKGKIPFEFTANKKIKIKVSCKLSNSDLARTVVCVTDKELQQIEIVSLAELIKKNDPAIKVLARILTRIFAESFLNKQEKTF